MSDHDHPLPLNSDTVSGAAPIGRRRFIAGAGAAVGATALAASLPSGAAHGLSSGASRFVPLPNGVRVADTREPKKYPVTRVNDRRIQIPLRGKHGVSATASAVVITVTGVNGGLGNYVSSFPSGGAVPIVSNLNMLRPGEVTANLATVKIGANGAIDVLSLNPAFLIVDVLGYYEPVSGATRSGRFIALPDALRAIDTRNLPKRFAGGFAAARSYTTVDLPSGVPADASSVVINLTATECTGPGFFSAVPGDFDEGKEPSTSSLNVSFPGQTRAAGVIVPVVTVGGKRRIKVFTLTAAKVIVDVVGYFTGESSPLSTTGLFVPVEPVRLMDTREPKYGQSKLWPRWVVEIKLPNWVAAEASAVIVNVTGVESRSAGFLSVTGARQPITATSNLNFTGPGEVVPNHVITPATSTHGIQVYSSHGCHVLADLAGFFTGSPKIPRVAKYVNPAPPAAPPEWTLFVPRLGLVSRVLEGDPRFITDSGHSWHWAGTGFMGQEGSHVSLFAHRTEAGAPYYGLDKMQIGDEFAVRTLDNREYVYRMVRRDLTDAQNSNILAATRFHPGTTLSLIACTVGFDRTKSRYPDAWAPTSLKYRIIVTGELVSWREL